MKEYHKIVTVWERDPETKFRTLIRGKWALPEFDYLKDLPWQWTEKLDGTNIRVVWDGEKVTVKGKTDNAQLYAPLVEWMQGKFYAGAMQRHFSGPVTLYGEGFGAGIQGGGKYRSDTVMVLFDVYAGMWLKREDVDEIARKLEIESVRIIGAGPLESAVALAEHGITSIYNGAPAEGLVMRPSVELLDRRGGRVITKIKTKDF